MRNIKKLIEAYVNQILKEENEFLFLEQEDEADLDQGADEGPGEADDLGDLELGDDADFSDEGGDLEGGGDAGAEGEDGDLEDGDLDGAEDFDAGGFGGGAGGFGGGSDFGGDDVGDEEESASEEEASEEGLTSKEVDMPDDPIQSTVNMAIDMLDETGDDNKILSAVKASIQSNFESFTDATPIITSLWQTEHPILKIVARKLLLFIKGI